MNRKIKVPYISGEWKILFEPQLNGNYVNDHSIVSGPDGKWHLYGITSFDGKPASERYFVHAVGESLDAPFREVGRSIDRGTLAWAPGVIKKDENYFMFYGPSPTSLAVSFDMYEWFGTNVVLNGEPLMSAHRDHFVLQISENEYLMYVAGVHNKKGAVSCFSSSDLQNWNFEGFALTSGDDAPLKPAWGAMESPFVVEKDGLFYLFVTYTDCSDKTYNNTLVFCSCDPKRFGEYNGIKGGTEPITVLPAHAPEIITEDGKHYITTCGWRTKPTPHTGAVSVAPLEWK
ncbi:MAG: family 43 glycosylhydrolase [Clostridia bacterium]|nr:family 43 glycosylhydrolase [Clostridia bacterium]